MKKKTLAGIIAVLFVVSGATGLIYQVVWFKYLSLFLGNTTYAQAVVLATFMGGLAIGASLWGRRADRTKQPLVLYAILEMGIAVYCLVYPTILSIVKNLFISFAISHELPSDGNTVLLLKILTSLSTLLLPTILMGGTLPVLVKYLSERIEESGKVVAKLYFLNSFGAVVGSMLGGFFFIQSLGLNATIFVAAACNLLIGFVALVIGKQMSTMAQAVASSTEESSLVTFTSKQVSLAVMVAGISGLAAMIYEVAWVRLLIPVLGSSTYSFTLMLVAFISGITIGSWLVARYIHRISNLFGFLASCQIGVALSLLLTLPIYGRIPYYFWHVAHVLTRSNSTYPIFLSIQFLFGFSIMLVPTIFLGMTLPVASRIASRNIQVLGRTIGNVFSINTLGTVVGSLAAGLILIPAVGVKHTIEVGLALNLLAGIIILMADALRPRGKKMAIVSITVVVAAMSLVIAPEWNRLFMITGVFRQINRNTEPPKNFAAFSAMYSQDDLLYYKEGASATVAVLGSRYTSGKQNVLLVNGKPDASSRADLPTQVLLGQLPLVFHPHAQDALVIGLGSGVTVGSILTHPIRSVDCVEISPEVVEASVHFNHVNNRPLEDPRTHLHIDDALSFLKLTSKNYDVIVSEPSNPWIAGIGSLYTKEFFQKCRERLNVGGLMVQWFHLYEMDDETFKLVVQTFQSSFRSVTVWQAMTMDVVLIGSEKPLTLDMDALKEKLNQHRVKEDFERIRIADPVVLLSLQIVSQDRLREYVGYGEVNTEDLPLLEYWAPRAFFVNKGVKDFSKYDERLYGGSGTILLKKYKDQFGLSHDEKRAIGVLHTTADGGNNQLGYSLLQEYLDIHADDAYAVELYSEACARLNRRDEGLDYLKRLSMLRRGDPNILEKYAMLRYQLSRTITSAIAPSSTVEPESLLMRCIELSSDTVDRFRIELGDMYLDGRQFKDAVDNYRRALEIREGHDVTQRFPQDQLLYNYASALSNAGDDQQAMAYAVQAYTLNAGNVAAKDLAYALYMKKGPGGDSNSQ